MSPLSGNANLCRLFIRSSGEWNRTDMRKHKLIARRDEVGVVESLFGRCSPMTRLRMLSR